MKKKSSYNEGLWKGVSAIVLGLIMLLWPGLTTNTIVTILGIGLLVMGCILLIGYFRKKKAGIKVYAPLGATVCLLLGLTMVVMPQVFINTLMIVFGIVLVLAGLDQILVLALGQRSGIRIPLFFYIAPSLILLIGFYIMFSPAISAQTFIMLFGITAIIYGIIALYNSYTLKRSVRIVKAIEIKNDEESV